MQLEEFFEYVAGILHAALETSRKYEWSFLLTWDISRVLDILVFFILLVVFTAHAQGKG